MERRIDGFMEREGEKERRGGRGKEGRRKGGKEERRKGVVVVLVYVVECGCARKMNKR